MPSTKRKYPAHPLVGVGAAVWKNDKILLIQRGASPRKGTWSLPGGLVQLGEDLESAVIREVREETGIEARLRGVALLVDLIDRDREDNVRHHYVVIDFAADWVSGEAKAGDDAADVAWADPDSLDAYKLTPQVLDAIARSRIRS
jgi:8-oxo-dGTP diphosphatase